MTVPLLFTVGADDDGERLDRYLAAHMPDESRARIARLIGDGDITVNGAPSRPSQKVRPGALVAVTLPPPEEATTATEEIPLTILYEDDQIIVVDKPAGMVTHPAPGHTSGTLVNALLGHCGDSLSGVGGVMRPGIVHRLDKETSGVIVAAKNDQAHQSLSEQLKGRTMSRLYVTVVKGELKPPQGTIDAPIGRSHSDRKKMTVTSPGAGREAVSRYQMVQQLGKVSVVEVTLQTGRTHQIRVHMKHINHPVVGDLVYGRGAGKYPIGRQALHAYRLKLTHPVTGEEMTFTAPLPSDLANLIASLGGDPAPWR